MVIIFRTHVKKLNHLFTQVANTPFINSPPLPPPDSRSSTPTQIGDESRPKSVSRNLDEAQVAQRSRWQAVLLEAGGLSAALSEESMQRLKYCLHWLQVRRSLLF
jgi:transcriptional repressor OPI1